MFLKTNSNSKQANEKKPFLQNPNENAKKMGISINFPKTQTSAEKTNGINSKFIKLKEKTQRDIEMIDKEISETLLVINNKTSYKNSKKQNVKSSSCSEQDLIEMRVLNKVFIRKN